MEPKLSHIKIVYKNKVKLMTGLEDETTFGDLIKAILVTRDDTQKSEKSSDDYIICQSVNGVEKFLDSKSKVREELIKVHKELEQFQTESKSQVLYLLRSKKSIDCFKKKEVTPKNDTFKSIDKLVQKFDFYIEERQVYIKLLEDYLMTMDLLEAEEITNLDTAV
ncbi:unnamed protein product [Brachionus calyciflorus]|uniref:Uncharacterized protein n=1 Tax=Brachionus calyciflorus TaxID=104777 RepID=A0A813VAR8_9BILA|nr:unnamed protein product [Brachionus calyciflorus]